MAHFNATLNGTFEIIGVSVPEQTQFYLVTQWIHSIDPSRPKHDEGINAGYVFLIGLAIVFIFGFIIVSIPQNMVEQAGTLHDMKSKPKKDHYVLKHDNEDNDNDKLKNPETIIYNTPTLMNQFEHSLSSTDTSVSSSDLPLGTDSETDDDNENEDNNSETSIELSPPAVRRLGTIIEEQEEQ